MGSSSQTGRERKMSLLVLLLISSAFGRPSSEVEADINEKVQQLDNSVRFINETRNLWNNSRLLGSVSADLLAAEQNILEMETELNNLQEVSALINPTNYFPKFNEAKSYLRQTRQELRGLAFKTVDEVKDLTKILKALDKSGHITLLKLLLAKMKDLMIETLKILKVANEKYGEAHKTFNNLVSSIEKQKGIVSQTLIKVDKKFQEDETASENSDCNDIALQVVTLGICKLVHYYVHEKPLEKSRAELAVLESKTDRLLDKTKILNRDIEEAIIVLSKEIELINDWVIKAEQVKNNIDVYSAKFLEKMKIIKDIFIQGLDDLKDAAQNYLDLTH